jgi:hypothetical protein
VTFPADLVNRALDYLGVEAIGDMEEGTVAARAASRQYVPLRQQLLNAAHWDFARKQVTMELVQDATAGQQVPNGFLYEYLMPTDCLQVRFVPQQSAPFVDFYTYSSTPVAVGLATVTPAQMSGTISDAGWAITPGCYLTINDGVNTEIVTVTATTGTSFTATFLYAHPNAFTINGRVPSNVSGNAVSSIPFVGSVQTYQMSRMAPASYVVATDIVTAQWGVTQFGDGSAYGLGASATVILSNVRAAQVVYTADINDPDEWSAQFEEAYVAALASKLAMAVVEDKKLAMAMLNQQVAIARAVLIQARASNANEGVTTLNRDASWIRARYARTGFHQGWNEGGSCGSSWSSFNFADGSTL